MSEVTIIGIAAASYVRTAIMICAEKGVDYEVEPIEFHSPAHLKVQPFGKMPAFRHGDVLLHETLAIGVYVDRSFDGAALQPSGPLVRGDDGAAQLRRRPPAAGEGRRRVGRRNLILYQWPILLTLRPLDKRDRAPELMRGSQGGGCPRPASEGTTTVILYGRWYKRRAGVQPALFLFCLSARMPVLQLMLAWPIGEPGTEHSIYRLT